MQELGTDDLEQLTGVELRDQDLVVRPQNLVQVSAWQWVEVPQVGSRDLDSLRLRACRAAARIVPNVEPQPRTSISASSSPSTSRGGMSLAMFATFQARRVCHQLVVRRVV